jgi:hypothetical protein
VLAISDHWVSQKCSLTDCGACKTNHGAEVVFMVGMGLCRIQKSLRTSSIRFSTPQSYCMSTKMWLYVVVVGRLYVANRPPHSNSEASYSICRRQDDTNATIFTSSRVIRAPYRLTPTCSGSLLCSGVAGRRPEPGTRTSKLHKTTDFAASAPWWLNLYLTGAVKTPVYVRSTDVEAAHRHFDS